MTSKINIIVNGYPKSGTTWLSKLVGDLLDCPVKGFWLQDGDKLTATGLHKISIYDCYKSHHTYEELKSSLNENTRLIYIIRDPRDVVVSGAYHFTFLPIKLKSGLKKLIASPNTRIRVSNLLNQIIPISKRKSKMLNLTVGKSDYPLQWMSNSWGTHVSGFINKNIFILKYEDLLDSPLETCGSILEYLECTISKTQLVKIIEKNTFGKKKQQYKQDNDYFNSRLLRKGIKNQWKKELSQKQIDIVNQEFKSLMSNLGYPE